MAVDEREGEVGLDVPAVGGAARLGLGHAPADRKGVRVEGPRRDSPSRDLWQHAHGAAAWVVCTERWMRWELYGSCARCIACAAGIVCAALLATSRSRALLPPLPWWWCCGWLSPAPKSIAAP